jgi:hypothetical protein
MADAYDINQPPYPFKLGLSRQAWHQVGRVAMLDELLRDIRTARPFGGNHVLDQPEIVLWLNEKRKAEVAKLRGAARKVSINDLLVSGVSGVS